MSVTLPAKNLLDGSKAPATTTAEMETAMGEIRDYLAALLGADTNFQRPGAERVSYVSATQIQLTRHLGKALPLYVGGAPALVEIPSAGTTLSNSGLTANKNYCIYAYDNSGTLALEATLAAEESGGVAHVTDSATGIEVKSGDTSRALVARVKMNASGQFADSSTQAFVCSWHNQPARRLWRSLASIGTFTTIGSAAEINSAYRIEWVEFGRPTVLGVAGIGSNTATNAIVECGVKVDGTTGQDTALVGGHVAAAFQTAITSFAALAWGEGYHYATTVGLVSSGTGSVVGSNSSINALLGANNG